MSNAHFRVPKAINEPVLSYAPGTPEREAVLASYRTQYNEVADIKMKIGGQRLDSSSKKPLSPPHQHQHVIGHYYEATEEQAKLAIEEALKAKPQWAAMPWEQR